MNISTFDSILDFVIVNQMELSYVGIIISSTVLFYILRRLKNE